MTQEVQEISTSNLIKSLTKECTMQLDMESIKSINENNTVATKVNEDIVAADSIRDNLSHCKNDFVKTTKFLTAIKC